MRLKIKQFQLLHSILGGLSSFAIPRRNKPPNAKFAGNRASINTHARTHTHKHAPWLLKHGCTYKNRQEHCGKTATTRYLILIVKLKAQTHTLKKECHMAPSVQNSFHTRTNCKLHCYTVRCKMHFVEK